MSSIKNIIKNTVIVLIILVILFIVINILIYITDRKINNKPVLENIENIFSREAYSITQDLKEQKAGIVSGENYKKKGIILFGCGFAAGLHLQDEQKFQAKLAPLVKRPVYNYGNPGSYIQNAILLVQSGMIDNVIKNCDYAVYMISGVNSDAYRLETYPGPYFDGFLTRKQVYPVLKRQKDTLEDSIIDKSFFSDSLMMRLLNKVYITNFKKEEALLKNTYIHLLKLQEELKKKNPNIKMILFLYFSSEKALGQYDDLLKEQGIQIFSAEDFEGDKIQEIPKYIQSRESFHPTEEAWNLLTPIFVKEMNLK